MLASNPASMVNQKRPDLGIRNRFKLTSSRFSCSSGTRRMSSPSGSSPPVAARGSAPVIGALCESSEHKKKPPNAEEERKQAEEQQSLQDIPDDDRLILKDAPRRQPWTVGIGYRLTS